jgi:predicted membrane-bound mannosyltransferase
MSHFTSDKILIKRTDETLRLVPHLVGRVLSLKMWSFLQRGE